MMIKVQVRSRLTGRWLDVAMPFRTHDQAIRFMARQPLPSRILELDAEGDSAEHTPAQ